MNLYRTISLLCVVVLLVQAQDIDSQTTQNPAAYNLKVSVDEVELTFHATDPQGLSVNDLRLDELHILDNGRPPRRTVLFETLRDLPIRAGILIDTSSSMEQNLPSDQAIAVAYVRRILQMKTDQAFVMDFGRRFQMRQTWSNNPDVLTSAIHQTRIFPSTTAILDTVYAVCRYQFGKLDHAASGNFILLFSDGEDDASFLSLEAAVNMCQQTNTAIYAFHAESNSGSTGTATLAQLASQTGGRVFRDSISASEIDDDLHLIEANLRNQYRLIYNPTELKRDGTFHRIVVVPPERIARINVRSGYYAPSR
ncbi:VWA domain-containing protein [Edaphobacter albus]|uniref:VWA domain-containing protein n=1 Tax=Edaphobacter sp. 4G125 TaxID=2763071 RepID=UPI001647868D|nr:VWA domain-containing protein [Edaphobacter sp. 4G125]QNI36397.1 VWA domain-containing protein [Edaphobacter sp. 4G125]